MLNVICMYTLYRDYFPIGYPRYDNARFHNLHYEIRDQFERLQFRKKYKKMVFVTSPSPDIDLEFIQHYGLKKDTCYASAYLMTQPLYLMLQKVMEKHVKTKIIYTLVTIIEHTIDFTRPEYKRLITNMKTHDIYESIYRNCVTAIGIEHVKTMDIDELFLVNRTIVEGKAMYDIKRYDRETVLLCIEKYIVDLKKRGKRISKHSTP